MLALAPWLALIAGIASVGWVAAGLMLGFGHAARAALAILMPGIMIGIGYYLAHRDPGYAIPDAHEASLHMTFTAILAFGAATVAVVIAIPLWFLLETYLGHRTLRD